MISSWWPRVESRCNTWRLKMLLSAWKNTTYLVAKDSDGQTIWVLRCWGWRWRGKSGDVGTWNSCWRFKFQHHMHRSLNELNEFLSPLAHSIPPCHFPIPSQPYQSYGFQILLPLIVTSSSTRFQDLSKMAIGRFPFFQ